MIDVIIPAYNAKETINKTLSSLAIQSIKDIVNIYIVNDCSNYDYQENINIFSKLLNIKEIKLSKNSGPGVARQFGIDNSNSKYVMFLDSDDVLFNNFSLEMLYNEMKNDDIDVCVSKIIKETETQYELYDNHTGCLHGKIYRRKYLENKNIKFNTFRRHEDNAFHKLVLMSEPKISELDYITYFYKFNENSITHQTDNYELDSIIEYIESMCCAFQMAEDNKYKETEIAKIVLTSILYLYFNCLLNEENINFDNIKNNLIKIKMYYSKYIKYLSEEEQVMIYRDQEFFNSIPRISFYEFLNKI